MDLRELRELRELEYRAYRSSRRLHFWWQYLTLCGDRRVDLAILGIYYLFMTWWLFRDGLVDIWTAMWGGSIFLAFLVLYMVVGGVQEMLLAESEGRKVEESSFWWQVGDRDR